MKQFENNIDNYFKLKVDPVILELDKDKAWKKLEKKRIIKKIRYYSIAVAAAILIAFISIIPNKTHNENDYIMSDFEKRQKLEEYESKISGTYVETYFCYDCSWDIMKSQVKQVPKNKIQLDVY